jgi:hypothetical protein
METLMGRDNQLEQKPLGRRREVEWWAQILSTALYACSRDWREGRTEIFLRDAISEVTQYVDSYCTIFQSPRTTPGPLFGIVAEITCHFWNPEGPFRSDQPNIKAAAYLSAALLADRNLLLVGGNREAIKFDPTETPTEWQRRMTAVDELRHGVFDFDHKKLLIDFMAKNWTFSQMKSREGVLTQYENSLEKNLPDIFRAIAEQKDRRIKSLE